MKGHCDSRSVSSCAACKHLKRKCTPNCIFAPYFPSEELPEFAKVHKVFGASNVSKLLSEVPQDQRSDTVQTLVYEAEARLKDPVYGCIGAMALLHNKMVELQHDLDIVRSHLALYTTSNLPSTTIMDDYSSMVPLVDYSGFDATISNSNGSELEQLGPLSSLGTFFQS